MSPNTSVVVTLRQAFSVPPLPNAAACDALLSTAEGFQSDSKQWAHLRDRQLASEIGQLAQQLAAVAQPTADALAAAATDADRQDECDLLIAYSHAASLAVLGCAAAAWSGCWDEWPDARNDLFRVVSAAKVVLVTGRLSLVVQLARAARQRQSGSGAADRWRPLLFETAVAQLAAMEKVAMKLACPHVNARLAATFAAAVAPPHLLLPWLAAVSQCLLEAWSCGMAGTEFIAQLANPFGAVLSYAVNEEAYSRHQQELEAPQGAALRRELAHAALRCLPPLAGAVEQTLGANGGDGSCHRSDASEAGRHGSSALGGGSSGSARGGGGRASRRGGGDSSSAPRAGDGSGDSDSTAAQLRSCVKSALIMLGNCYRADVLQQAITTLAAEDLLDGLRAGVRIALALPLQPPAGMLPVVLASAHAAAAQCMAVTSDGLLRQPAVKALWEQRGSGLEQQATVGAEAAAAAQVTEAARQGLGVLPRVAAVLPCVLAAHAEERADWLDCMAGYYAYPMQLPYLLGSFRTADEVAEWAAACEAGVRLLPLLLSAVAPDGSEAEQQQGTAGSEGGSDSGPACEAEDMAQRFADVC